MSPKTKRRKWVFKAHVVSIRVRHWHGGFCFHESHLRPSHAGSVTPVFKTYDLCVKAMQRYSKRHYGEKAV